MLDISECESISGQGLIEGIARQSNLTLNDLNVSALNICEISVIKIAENLSNLLKLNLNFCFNAVTELSLQMIFKHLILLRELHLDYCDKITDAALTGMSMTETVRQYEQEQKITEKSVSDQLNIVTVPIPIGANAIDDTVVHGIMERRHIKISLGSKAEDEIIRDANRKKMIIQFCEQDLSKTDWSGYSVSRLKGLRILTLAACNKISDISLQYSFKLPELHTIRLAKCQQISNEGIKDLVRYCHSLESVNLAECHNINDKTIELLTMNLKRLKHLYLEGCVQLTDFSLDHIIIYCKVIKVSFFDNFSRVQDLHFDFYFRVLMFVGAVQCVLILVYDYPLFQR